MGHWTAGLRHIWDRRALSRYIEKVARYSWCYYVIYRRVYHLTPTVGSHVVPDGIQDSAKGVMPRWMCTLLPRLNI